MGFTSLSEEEIRRVGVVATDLRITQVQLCDENPLARESKLAEQMTSALADVPLSSRTAFLQALADRFPTWEDSVEPAVAAAPNPESLFTGLAEAGRNLPEDKRRDMVTRLQKSWSLPPPPPQAALPAAAAEEIRNAVGLTAADNISLSKLAQLTVAMVELVCTLDSLGSKVWRGVNSRLPVPKKQLKLSLAKHLKGEPQASAVDELLELRSLIAALLSAIPDMGARLHSDLLWRFTPADIEEAVRVEGGSAFVGMESKCWRRYVRMVPELEEHALTSKINELLVKMVEPCLTARR